MRMRSLLDVRRAHSPSLRAPSRVSASATGHRRKWQRPLNEVGFSLRIRRVEPRTGWPAKGQEPTSGVASRPRCHSLVRRSSWHCDWNGRGSDRSRKPRNKSKDENEHSEKYDGSFRIHFYLCSKSRGRISGPSIPLTLAEWVSDSPEKRSEYLPVNRQQLRGFTT